MRFWIYLQVFNSVYPKPYDSSYFEGGLPKLALASNGCFVPRHFQSSQGQIPNLQVPLTNFLVVISSCLLLISSYSYLDLIFDFFQGIQITPQFLSISVFIIELDLVSLNSMRITASIPNASTNGVSPVGVRSVIRNDHRMLCSYNPILLSTI